MRYFILLIFIPILMYSQVNFSDIKKLADYIIINNEEDFILPQIMRIHNDILKKQ